MNLIGDSAEKSMNKCNHIYDEYGLCFECDKRKPVSRAADNKRSRDKRRDAGLVEFRCWVTPKKREQLRKLYNGK